MPDEHFNQYYDLFIRTDRSFENDLQARFRRERRSYNTLLRSGAWNDYVAWHHALHRYLGYLDWLQSDLRRLLQQVCSVQRNMSRYRYSQQARRHT